MPMQLSLLLLLFAGSASATFDFDKMSRDMAHAERGGAFVFRSENYPTKVWRAVSNAEVKIDDELVITAAAEAPLAAAPTTTTYGAQQKRKQCFVNGDKAVHHGDRTDNPVFGGGGFIGTLTLDECKARCDTDKGPRGRPCVAIEFVDGGGDSSGKKLCALLWGCDYVRDWTGGSVYEKKEASRTPDYLDRAPTTATATTTNIKATTTWQCDDTVNFIVGARYSQLRLTDYCPDCSANPKYGALNDNQQAVEYCKQEASKRGSPGFFFQQHTNGHEICGFYVSSAAMASGARKWHGHRAGQICELVATPTSATTTTSSSSSTTSTTSTTTIASTTAPAVAAFCAAQCKARGFCCNDFTVGSNQFLSCSQACMVRQRGSSKGECKAACDAPRSCTKSINGFSYGRCQRCSDRTARCPHGVQNADECKAGCEMLAPAQLQEQEQEQQQQQQQQGVAIRPATAHPHPPTTTWQCDTTVNFVDKVASGYSQISLTDSCPDCSARPKYGWPNNNQRAVEYCEQEANKRGAVGFFYQQHHNGHEVCGFFSNFGAMSKGTRQWDDHKFGQVCELSSASTKQYCALQEPWTWDRASSCCHGFKDLGICGWFSGRAFYIMRPGLTGESGTVSFKDLSTGIFLRHRNFLLRYEANDASELFRKDATFYERAALSGTTGFTSFESVNYPGRFVAHRGFRLRIAHSGDSDLHRRDASFKVEAAPSAYEEGLRATVLALQSNGGYYGPTGSATGSKARLKVPRVVDDNNGAAPAELKAGRRLPLRSKSHTAKRVRLSRFQLR
eukprot:g2944.t1